MVFHWSLSDRNSLQVSRTPLGILTVLNTVELLDGLHLSFFSKSSSPFNNSSGIVSRAPIIIGHFHVPQFFSFPSKVQVFVLLFIFFHFYAIVSQDSNVHIIIIIIIIIVRLFVC